MAASCPHTVFLGSHIGSHNSWVLRLVTRGLLPNVLTSIHKICLHRTQLFGLLKTAKEGGDYSIFIKGETFLVSLKLSAIRGNITLHHSCLPLPKNTSFLQFPKQRIYVGTYLKKSFWFVLVPYPHRQSRKSIMNTFLMISRCM